jgi:hypothetical protein
MQSTITFSSGFNETDIYGSHADKLFGVRKESTPNQASGGIGEDTDSKPNAYPVVAILIMFAILLVIRVFFEGLPSID